MRHAAQTFGAAHPCSTRTVNRRNPGRPGLLHFLVPLSVLLAASTLFAGSTEFEALADPGIIVSEADQSAALQAPMGIAVDAKRGELLVANTGLRRVDIFDLEGYPIAHFTHRVRDAAGNWIAGAPWALAVDGEGRVLLIDQFAPYVDVLDYAGRPLQQIVLPAPDDRLDTGGGPGSIAVRANGNILVATRGDSGRIHEFNSDFQFERSWDIPGTDPGRLSRIAGLCETPSGGVVVVCSGTRFVVQVFDTNAGYVNGFGIHDVGPGNFSLPSGVAVTDDGRIWASDELRQIVQAFDSAGNFLGMMGGGGSAPGEFLYPSALASDGHGLLAVAERVGNRCQLLVLR